jgi:RND family efflux transporter MFP subunit
MNKIVYVLALLLAVVITACKQSQPQGEEEHAHEENLQLTSYSNDFEVYAEAKPFVVGKESSILAHFSYLSNFKPITEGSITISLIVGTNGVRQTLEKPTRTGIYSFALKPEVAGTGKLVFDIQTPDKKSQIVVPGIKVYTDVHDAQHEAADAVASSSNGVVFTKEQSWKVDFATEPSRKEPFGQVIKTMAQVLPSQGDERIVTAKTSGIVSFSGNEIVNGKPVTANQNLFTIESGDMAENNLGVRYKEAVSGYNRAKAEYERKRNLTADKIVSESDLLKSKAEFETAEAVYNNLRKNFVSGRQSVSAPISGFVKQVLVRNGEYVEAGQLVVTVSQNKDLLIKANVQPRFYASLSGMNDANFRVMNNGQVYSLEALGGKVLSYGKSAEVNNPLIPVLFQVNNTVELIPGTFVETYIKTQTTQQAVTVPNVSIVEEMGNYFVYVQLTPEYFEKRLVKTGVSDGKRTEIKEGLSGNERVVSTGAILVKLAQASGALDAHSGHVH